MNGIYHSPCQYLSCNPVCAQGCSEYLHLPGHPVGMLNKWIHMCYSESPHCLKTVWGRFQGAAILKENFTAYKSWTVLLQSFALPKTSDFKSFHLVLSLGHSTSYLKIKQTYCSNLQASFYRQGAQSTDMTS